MYLDEERSRSESPRNKEAVPDEEIHDCKFEDTRIDNRCLQVEAYTIYCA